MQTLIRGAARLGIELDQRAIGRFELYYRELLEWNRKCNLTAVTDYECVQTTHFLDSLTNSLALPRKDLDDPQLCIVDVGSGAGFPGLPLKIVFPSPSLLLVESTAKKTAFLLHVVQRLGLQGVEVKTGRAEEIARLPAYRERSSLVLSRAVAPLPTLMEVTLPFCQTGGRVVAQKKGEVEQELADASHAIAILGGRLGPLQRIAMEELEGERYLVIVDKICPTPALYPRRPGVPRRRPISGGA